MIRNPILLVSLSALLLGGLACGKPKVVAPPKAPTGKTAAMLLEEGEALLKRRKWDEGRKTLRMVEDFFPSSPEFSRAKILMGDSYFFANTTSFPEALVEYQSFLNYFPRHEMREYALHRIGLCHYASIVDAERDQTQTLKAIEAFQTFLREAPGSIYAVDCKAKVTQCYRRLAEAELLVGIFYVNNLQYGSSERRLKELLEKYPEYVDRERAYYYLGEALRNKMVSGMTLESWQRAWFAKEKLDDTVKLAPEKQKQFGQELATFLKEEVARYREEARSYYQRLVESYPNSRWTGRAKDRLIEMGTTRVKEELDS